ncbi:MAG: hypothetical protein FWC16_05600 [Defluviitaleaceae bacterium]|nr:hypothetical protein [Defluviitaleaceae bacterium]MCL2274384.1 hypothetical protein [Defluviitaleaceae bacterium]
MAMLRCNKCKQMYDANGIPTGACDECTAKKNAMLDHVRQLVKAQPGISPQAVSAQTGVPVNVVIRYIANEA